MQKENVNSVKEEASGIGIKRKGKFSHKKAFESIESREEKERERYSRTKIRRISEGINSININFAFPFVEINASSESDPPYIIYPDVSYSETSQSGYLSFHENSDVHYCFPFVESSSSEQKSKFKLPEINVHNVIEWRESVLVELRAENPNYTIVLQYDQPRWYSTAEDARIRLLLNPVPAGAVPIANLHAAVTDAIYRRAQATAAYNLINFGEREEKYIYYNSKLYGLIEKACAKSLEAVIFLKQRMTTFIEGGGDLTNLDGRTLLVDIVELFKRDTIRTKGEKVKTF